MSFYDVPIVIDGIPWFFFTIWVCLKIVYPYTQWLMIIIPTKWLFHWEYTQHFQTNPYTFKLGVYNHCLPSAWLVNNTQESGLGTHDQQLGALAPTSCVTVASQVSHEKYKKQWKITIFNGKIHYKWSF